ncbi:putative secondary metabolism biosynthetic enzyme [Trichoderma asperellum]|uniref:putative secondary metabolism biosynthetic enzyme n=1 Tax=Trichoderma asperellum TaxID=101201 RepID=UPI0033197D31|nr:putative secondary metabolism biosynthetic enzyme [Trichoderma asperellum]
MASLAKFHLAEWIHENSEHAKYNIAGSAAPSLTLRELISLSGSPSETEAALKFDKLPLGLGTNQGSLELRTRLAALYNEKIQPENFLTTPGATGANLIVFQSFLRPGDHVICMYPTYTQLSNLSKSIGCDVSLWRLDPNNEWCLDMAELRVLIRPSTTKMIILNNPNNPTGSVLDAKAQLEILEIAQQHGVIVVADEIFRPLYHNRITIPSFVEHEYTKVITTSSMSKAWGMSGVRIGWIVCRDQDLTDLMSSTKQYIAQATSNIDEAIATECLSLRCRPAILKRHLEYAQQNLELLEAFVKKNSDMCTWIRPTAGGTAFVKYHTISGDAIDDVQFCQDLLKDYGVLLSPGSICFGEETPANWQGYARMHITVSPENMQKALLKISTLLGEKRKTAKYS